MTHRFCFTVLIALWAVTAAPAQEAPPPEVPESRWDFQSWKLDRVTLRSGKTLEGLIEAENDRELRLMEIRRPEGRGLFGASRSYKRAEIASIERLGSEDRQESRQRLDQYLQRGRVEAIERSNVELEEVDEAPGGCWRYRGTWYTLESRASQELTRRVVCRLEQMFTAYRRVLPPRVARREELRIVLHGTSAEYQALARSLGASLENAAFYHPRRNLVAAGSDLARLAGQLAQVQAQHDAMRTELEKLRRDLPGRLEEHRKKLSVTHSEAAVRKILVNYRRQFLQDIGELEQKTEDFDRQNEATLEQQAGRVLALLRHEAFHAYLENYVYPQSEHDVPRWLNEGLAQMFEHSRLEADLLRVDVPDKAVLARLANDLAARPATLAQVLSADHRSYLISHQGDRDSQLNYAYAWGLAHYLTFVRPVFGGAALDQYVSKSAAGDEPIARFERLVDQPLAEFEDQWRAWVLKRK